MRDDPQHNCRKRKSIKLLVDKGKKAGLSTTLRALAVIISKTGVGLLKRGPFRKQMARVKESTQLQRARNFAWGAMGKVKTRLQPQSQGSSRWICSYGEKLEVTTPRPNKKPEGGKLGVGAREEVQSIKKETSWLT